MYSLRPREIRCTIRVAFRHRVIFTRDVLDDGNEVLERVLEDPEGGPPPGVLVFVDAGVARARPDIADAACRYFASRPAAGSLRGEPREVPGGERAKAGWTVVGGILDAIRDARLCRHSYAVTIGGGAVLDVVGFAASIAHRGIRQVRIPTTVLAQDDAGVGIKNGIDAFGRKNWAGAFSPPHAVINDASFLRTLDDANWRAGTAEAVKAALIRDPSFFRWIERNASRLAQRDMAAMERLVRRCAELHVRHIAAGGDPFERGRVRPLDFGHWAAHRIEQATRYEVGHGAAVAVGMALDVLYSRFAGMLRPREADRILRVLAELGFDLWCPALEEADVRTGAPAILAGLDDFREHMGGRLCIVLLEGIGRPTHAETIDPATVARAIEGLRRLGKAAA